MVAGKSGREVGSENVARLRDYLGDLARRGLPLPTRGGEVNVSAVALACGFNRQVLYVNETAKALLAEAAARSYPAQPSVAGDDEKPVAKSDRRDRRIHRLEQENASLKAENAGLRERLRRLDHVEAVMVSGRRVPS